MAMVRMTQAEEVQQVLGCSSSEARHYLRIFDGDQERAVRVVLQHMEDKDWWGHPWNSKESAELMDDDPKVFGDNVFLLPTTSSQHSYHHLILRLPEILLEL